MKQDSITPTLDRQLVSVETIGSISPIEGADMIVAAKIKGWTVVVNKNEFHSGDQCVYFEIDSMLPLRDERFAFLAPRGSKEIDGESYHRLKTARLKGVYSQGLALPVDQFDLSNLDKLGVFKYEPPALTQSGDLLALYPDRLAKRTRSERVQNLADVWDQIISLGTWVATEKVDGTSMSVFKTPAGELLVCGHNYVIREGDNIYWNAVRDYHLDDLLDPGVGIQCELYGPGIQKNPLRMKTHQIAIFAVIIDRVPTPRSQWNEKFLALAAPVYDFQLPTSVELALDQVHKIQSLVSPGHSAEGVVWTLNDASYIEAANGYSMKAISASYLLKHGD